MFPQKILFLVSSFPLLLLSYACDTTDSNDGKSERINNTPLENSISLLASCQDGFANEYPCDNIDLVGKLTPEELLGTRLNDIWGWTDSQTGKEYALVGLSNRVTFVDISTPSEPVVVGTLPESSVSYKDQFMSVSDDDHAKGSAWRDVKVFNNYAFIVSDGQSHGMQIFDLTSLRSVAGQPVTFSEDAHFTGFERAHNIAINEETAFAYVVGSEKVGGGLYILDISSPLNPRVVGSHADSTVGRASTGYVHDTQCVTYSGPDSDYQGREICFNSSETHLVIADVEEKDSTYTISKASYVGNDYAHQGWLSENHRYFLLDDELDELRRGVTTTTYIWDLQDLDDPEFIGIYESETSSVDHNQYIKGNFSYQANYTSGLRIIDISNIGSGNLEEIAYFDTFPAGNAVDFDGAWSNFPFFESGIIVVSDISNGLFILKPTIE